jgi:hypothetical protein
LGETVAAIGLESFGAALAALGALSTAAFGLLDSTKAFWGGVSNVGLGHLRTALKPFDPALAAAVGEDNGWTTVRANWVNGIPKPDQKATIRALIKLGLSPATARSIAQAAHVDPAALEAAAKKLAVGKDLTDADLNVLGRMNAVIDALLDAAFENADQQFKNVSRVLAGAVAIGLAIAAWALWPDVASKPELWAAIGVGLLAVPVAPVAKDLTSALSAAMRALKAAKAI